MRLQWDKEGEHFYETGTSHGVLYLRDADGSYPTGVPWNGLTAVTENASGAEATPLYADDIKYLNLYSAEEFGITIEAYTYPDEFAKCDGSEFLTDGVSIGQQPRQSFGFSYQTIIGNDVENDNYGYKIHCVYGATASPSEKNYTTVNDSPEAVAFSWEVNTVPVNVTGFKPTACVTIDSTKFKNPSAKKVLEAFENILYGDDEHDARLPMPDEILELLKPVEITTKVTDGTTERYSVPVNELQENIKISGDKISGILKHKDSYTGFSTDDNLKSGYYLALDIEVPEDATVTVEIIGGDSEGHPKEINDKFLVAYIKNTKQKIKLVAKQNGKESEKTYDLSGLKLNGVG